MLLPDPNFYARWQEWGDELRRQLRRKGELTPLQLPTYTVDSLPRAAEPGQLAYCTDEIFGATPVYSDGTNWRRVYDKGVALGSPEFTQIATFGSSYNTWTTAITKDSDQVLFVALSIEDSGTPTVSTATFDGDAMTQDAYQNVGATTKNRVWLYRLPSSKTSGDVVITMSETTDLSGLIFGVKGITGGPLDSPVEDASAASASSLSDTFTPSQGMLINVISNGGNDMLIEPANGETLLARVNGSSQDLHVSRKEVPNSSITTGWARTSGASTSPRMVQVTPVYAIG